ncbi:haloacid dehalogenase-like hydrolase [Croceibacterium sp. LX-88]|uniref:Haloacid dehalogenase-like hydrolase n=1 Tax=Croceibacterium selenioxidans TaxID=2838833 RepID=A0ABS5W9D5_9SPHN|nr:HAD family hydrolase [Croceibacterium selenioxidans]MBT2135928.1 haloacid dehalogenase-like hydrolase [Croceibacterium selenioxidans]
MNPGRPGAVDPLPSWNPGRAKSVLLDFVARVTDQSGADFVPPADRVATFDNDGTLWCEYPLQVQVFFLVDRVKALRDADPSVGDRQPFKALLEHDAATLHSLGKQGLMELFAATHAGMSEEEFGRVAHDFLATAKHPKLGTLFSENVYRPQVELLKFLRGNGFRTFIVTGGGIEFVRAISEQRYGVMRDEVVGSNDKLQFEIVDGKAQVKKLGELNSFDDREAKPANIALHIGRRPILAFGNSDGDLAMLRYALGGEGPRLALLLHHDDAEREFAYDREFHLSPLAEALDKADAYGIVLTSMKTDWAEVF